MSVFLLLQATMNGLPIILDAFQGISGNVEILRRKLEKLAQTIAETREQVIPIMEEKDRELWKLKYIKLYKPTVNKL